jgi:hypothetical protein
MIKQTNFKEFLLKKEIKTICISIGGLYFAIGALSFLMMLVQKSFLNIAEPMPDDSFSKLMEVLHKIWRIYMPLLMGLGLSYLIFGFLFNKIKGKKFMINFVLGFLSLIWASAYSISSFEFIDVFSANSSNEIMHFKYISYFFASFGFIMVFALLTVPQFIIGKRIKKEIID